MIYKTKQEKKDEVLKYLNDGKTYREIQKLARVTPNFISTISKQEFGNENIINNNNIKPSKNTIAIKMFSENKSPMAIALELDIDSNETFKAYHDFLKLNNLQELNHLILNENKNKLILIIKLVELLKHRGITSIESVQKILFDIKYSKTLNNEINLLCIRKNELNYENLKIQDEINKKNKILETKNRWIRFLKYKHSELMNEISKKQEIRDRN